MRATSPRLSIRTTEGFHLSRLALSTAEAGRLEQPLPSGQPNRGEVAPLLQAVQPRAARVRSILSKSILSKSARSKSARSQAARSQAGQATVEFALVLVALVGAVWALLSLCLVVRDQVLVTHASREAARTYAVTRSIAAATQAARDRSGLGENLLVTVEPQADNLARLTVSLNIASRVPLVGRVRPGLQLQSSLITFVEPG